MLLHVMNLNLKQKRTAEKVFKIDTNAHKRAPIFIGDKNSDPIGQRANCHK